MINQKKLLNQNGTVLNYSSSPRKRVQKAVSQVKAQGSLWKGSKNQNKPIQSYTTPIKTTTARDVAPLSEFIINSQTRTFVVSQKKHDCQDKCKPTLQQIFKALGKPVQISQPKSVYREITRRLQIVQEVSLREEDSLRFDRSNSEQDCPINHNYITEDISISKIKRYATQQDSVFKQIGYFDGQRTRCHKEESAVRCFTKNRTICKIRDLLKQPNKTVFMSGGIKTVMSKQKRQVSTYTITQQQSSNHQIILQKKFARRPDFISNITTNTRYHQISIKKDIKRDHSLQSMRNYDKLIIAKENNAYSPQSEAGSYRLKCHRKGIRLYLLKSPLDCDNQKQTTILEKRNKKIFKSVRPFQAEYSGSTEHISVKAKIKVLLASKKGHDPCRNQQTLHVQVRRPAHRANSNKSSQSVLPKKIKTILGYSGKDISGEFN